jgi:hypothetical protein
MKPFEIVVRRKEGNDGRVKIYCTQICKYCNASPVQLLYTNKLKEKKDPHGRSTGINSTAAGQVGP